MLFLSALILLLTVMPLFSIFGIKKFISALLGGYISFFGLIVLTAEISGFLNHLSSKEFFLILQILELVVVWTVWFFKGKPKIFSDIKSISFRPFLSKGLVWIKKNPLVFVFFIVTFSGYLVLAWLIIRVPPNNSDSMHTHLARVIYYLQQDSFKLLTAQSVWAQIYPFNAQLNLLWTILFTGTDKYVGFVQYFAALFAGVAIFGISRIIKGSISLSILSVLFWLSFPMVVFQATSTQFDLVVTALFVASVYFLFDFIANRTTGSIFFSALAMGLALGTKTTILMVGPGILSIGLIILLIEKGAIKWLMRWTSLVLICFFLLGSFVYFSNLYHFNNPLGPTEFVKQDSYGRHSFKEKIKYNLPRFIYQFISFDSLPLQIADKGLTAKSLIFNKIDDTFNLGLETSNSLKDPAKLFLYENPIAYNEDLSWFGFSSFLLLTVSGTLAIINGFRKRDLIPIYLIILAISFVFFEILLRPGWDPYQGRYFLICIAILTPLVSLISDTKLTGKVFLFFIGLIAITQLFFSVVSNEVKPILGIKIFEYKYVNMENTFIPQNAIQSYYRKYSLKLYSYLTYNLPFYKTIDDYDVETLRVFPFRSTYEKITRRVNEIVPNDAIMGVILKPGDYDYPFFGSKLKRRLININPVSNLYDEQWFGTYQIEYVLISNKDQLTTVPDFLKLIENVDGWRIYSVKGN